MSKNRLLIFTLCCAMISACGDQGNAQIPETEIPVHHKEFITGADQTDLYIPILAGKRVAIVANQTSRIGQRHLVDTLLSRGVEIVCVFAPEHGFRGDVGAGEKIQDGKDPRTGLPVYSLYGKTKKPSREQMQSVDILVFDIQDVGARFYTYISTMHYAMEAAAENGKSIMVLDRPNPNGFYVDGPVLDPAFQSFVGMHPIPVVHGCTVGELAEMINGEKWLSGGIQADLKVIPCSNYTHSDFYELPVPPSPNLPNMSAIYLYPSLCFFEGTVVSVGRGTALPFQSIGYPGNTTGRFHFVPKDVPGVVTDPPHEGKECTGHDLAAFGSFYFKTSRHLFLDWLTGLYAASADQSAFFNQAGFFDKLAGSDKLRKMVIAGKQPEEIRMSWKDELTAYKAMRKRYLMYPDFE